MFLCIPHLLVSRLILNHVLDSATSQVDRSPSFNNFVDTFQTNEQSSGARRPSLIPATNGQPGGSLTLNQFIEAQKAGLVPDQTLAAATSAEGNFEINFSH